jgi:hypothetical protein
MPMEQPEMVLFKIKLSHPQQEICMPSSPPFEILFSVIKLSDVWDIRRIQAFSIVLPVRLFLLL